MAFPQLRSESTGAQTSNTTTHTVTLPATVSAGDLLRVTMAFDGNPTVTWDNTSQGAWTLIFNTANGTVNRLVCYAKIASGSEASGTLSIGTSASEQSVYRASSVYDWYGTIATGVASATATGTSSTPDAPNLAPGWGALDIWWIDAIGVDNGATTLSSYPTNYTLGQFFDTSAGSQGACLGSSRRELNASSENPGTYTVSASRGWVAATIAIRPGSSTSVAITGQSATGSVGAFGKDKSLTTTGQGAVGFVGTLGKSVSTGVSGFSATGSLGSITPNTSYSVGLQGSSATGSIGSLGITESIPVVGQQATGSLGAITPSAGYSIPLGGQGANASIGTLKADLSLPTSGQSATGSLGSLAKTESLQISGIQGSGAVGSVQQGIGKTLSGLEASAFEGIIVPSMPSGAEFARVSQAYVEVPQVSERARVSQAYFELPQVAEHARVSQAYFELPEQIVVPGVSKQQPAGRPSRGRYKRKFVVEIDGQTFLVSSEREAENLLSTLKESAEELAKVAADSIVSKRLKKASKSDRLNVLPLRLETPQAKIRRGDRFNAYANDFLFDLQDELDRIYRQARMEAEILLLLRKQWDVDEDEALVALLLS